MIPAIGKKKISNRSGKGEHMRTQANLVIIGAGIVGASAAYHLTKLGWRDIVVLDKGPLYKTGGSTSHAPGLVFQTNGSRMLCKFAQYTVELLNNLHTEQRPTFYQVGGIEVAYTKDRWTDLHRRHGWAQSYGLESAIISPKEVQEHIPIAPPHLPCRLAPACSRHQRSDPVDERWRAVPGKTFGATRPTIIG
jgi:glycine/D-amino acid oxidase-like deaminating enzyme